MNVPLYPLEDAHNFQVGEPLNGNHPHCPEGNGCRVPGRDYSGAELPIQYPRNWHVVAGFGGAMGGFHQDPFRFEPTRVFVTSDPKEHKSRNVLQCTGGAPFTPGKFMLSKWFDTPVTWMGQQALRVEFVFMPASQEEGAHYLNLELRGELNAKVLKNEAVQCFGLHFFDHQIMTAYWLNARDGSTLDARAEHKVPHDLAPDQWHRLVMEMTPTGTLDTWHVTATLSARQTVLWMFSTNAYNAPNNVRSISQIAFGDERERDERGGLWYIARAMCWAVP